MVPELRLREAILTAAPGVTGIEVGTFGDSSTVKVTPDSLQPAAQAAINAFDWTSGAHAAWIEGKKPPERKALHDAAAQAVADNNAFLAVASPNNAQVVAQVKRLTQECTALVKRLIQLD